MEKLKGYKMFVYPQWIDDLIDGKKVSNYDGRKYVILEVNSKKKSNHKIRNSIFMDFSFLETEEVWNRPSDEKIKEILLSKGITKDTMVILYGPNFMASNRCAAVMKYAGVEDIRILNGGTKRLEKETGRHERKQIERERYSLG